MFPPPELWPLMEQQGSLLFRAQLLAAGVTPSTIDKRLGRGQLVAVQSGVYRLPGAALEPRQLIRAATERANGYATGWSALGLYGVLDLDARLAPWVASPVTARSMASGSSSSGSGSTTATVAAWAASRASGRSLPCATTRDECRVCGCSTRSTSPAARG
ncbi:MAG: hypothetical protein ACRDYX_03710 [Egibacteraceae bacterium]